jgi:hypothetical protein
MGGIELMAGRAFREKSQADTTIINPVKNEKGKNASGVPE